jgi:MFS family permease
VINIASLPNSPVLERASHVLARFPSANALSSARRPACCSHLEDEKCSLSVDDKHTLTMSRFSMTPRRAYNWYISLVAASCMVLYGYDASVYNAVQGSKHWVAYFNTPNENIIGAVNTAYTVGAIVAGFFFGGPVADYFGRRIGMASGAVFVIVATFMQTFSPRGSIGCFIAGRVFVGIGQGLALTAGSIYIGEMAPLEIRGTIMSFWQMFYSVGSFIAYWVSYQISGRRLGIC